MHIWFNSEYASILQ